MVVPLPLTVKAPYTGPVVPIPTLPPAKIPNNDPPEVKDGVVPVNDKAALLPDKVSVEKVGVPVVEISWAAFKVTDEPSETAPPPVKPVPAVTVTDELTKLELVTTEAGRVTDPPFTRSPPESTVPDVTVKDEPIPTLPTRLDIPVTFKVDRAEAEVTDNDCPTPTLPEVTRDPPTPTLPKLAVDTTARAKPGLVVPIPTLPLSNTVNPWTWVEETVWKLMPVVVPAPRTNSLPYGEE